MQRLALIADVVGSRKVADRAELQQRIKKVLKTLNGRRPDLLSPYTVTLGDEFQALFASADRVLRDVVHIMSALYPVQVRFALGVGEITTDINPDQALGMDGPAFYHARDGMTRLKGTDHLINLTGMEPSLQRLCNHSLQLFSYTLHKWRHSRYQILAGLLEGHTVKDLVVPLGVSDKAIYKNISDGALETIQGLLADMSEQLNQAIGASLEPQPPTQSSEQEPRQEDH